MTRTRSGSSATTPETTGPRSGNPGHLLARYNLACATLRLGDKAGALSILRELAAAAGCPECKRILSHARSDGDMADLRDSAEFKKLTAR